jgi:hypothetical protein
VNIETSDNLSIYGFVPCKDCGGTGRIPDNNDFWPCHDLGKVTDKIGNFHVLTAFATKDGHITLVIKKI